MSDDNKEGAADIQKLIDSAPDHIWLDLGEEAHLVEEGTTFKDLGGVTWSEDNATGHGIKYVRATPPAVMPAAPSDAAEVERLREDAERYKLLRRGQHWSVIDGMGYTLRAEQIDAAIDQAIARGTK